MKAINVTPVTVSLVCKLVSPCNNLLIYPRSAAAALLRSNIKLECGPMPNVMVALPNIGGALCSTPQSLADAHY